MNKFTVGTAAERFPLLNAAYSKNVWNSQCSALNCLYTFCNSTGQCLSWPLNAGLVNNFTNWMIQDRKLAAKTATAYLTAIENRHLLLEVDSSDVFNPLNKLMLKGASNLESLKSKNRKNIFSLPLLKLLGHYIAVSDWLEFSKITIWVVALIAFFGSCRIGELLPISWNQFDKDCNLTWQDIIVNDDSIQLRIKSPKSKVQGGEFVDIFEFKGHGCCPVANFKKYRDMAALEGLLENDKPVFRLKNGKLLTKNLFNSTINDLLKDFMAKSGAKLTGHSFRAAIPAMLAKFPEIAKENHILGWGRWSSKAYLCYTRLKIRQKKVIYEKIVSILNKK